MTTTPTYTLCTLNAFAATRRLDPARLRELHIHDAADGLRLPCLDEHGKATGVMRVRQWIETAHPTTWIGKPMLFGLQVLRRARERGELVLVEGESDQLTLRQHAIASLGVPGSSMTHLIEASHAEGIERVYTIREPDESGVKFITTVAKRLRELGHTRELHVIDLHAMFGLKDASALHVDDPERFVERWNAAIKAAQPYGEPTTAASSEAAKIEWDDAHPWPTLDEAALYGLAGDFVRLVAPESESDPAALLAMFLAFLGAAAGPSASFDVESTRHPARENVVIVGATSSARKGTATEHVKRVFRMADEEWSHDGTLSGLASGEGLIAQFVDCDDDAPARRKNVVILEPEFARTLVVAAREGSIVSHIIREAFDSGNLANLTRKAPLKARDVHAGIVGHITSAELVRRLPETEAMNGFGNRMLFVCARRSKKLPFGGALKDADFTMIATVLRKRLDFARTAGRMQRDDAANERWASWYCELEDEAGLLGAVTARAEAHVLRLSMIYALLDASTTIRHQHVEAALALWNYARGSAAHIFGALLGDRVQDRLLNGLRNARGGGLTGAEQDALFQGNLKRGELADARAKLERRALVRTQDEQSGGRPTIRSFAIPRTEKTEKVKARDVNPLNPYAEVFAV
jgi:hypothetical protein